MPFSTTFVCLNISYIDTSSVLTDSRTDDREIRCLHRGFFDSGGKTRHEYHHHHRRRRQLSLIKQVDTRNNVYIWGHAM